MSCKSTSFFLIYQILSDVSNFVEGLFYNSPHIFYLSSNEHHVDAMELSAGCLADYGLSQPVKTSYGYHIILRLPLSADAVVSYDNTGAAVTGRSLFASYDYAAGLDAYLENLSVEYVDGFQAPDLSKYVN